MKKLITVLAMFALLGVSAAYAKTLEFNLPSPVKAGSTELPKGHYKVKIEGETATIKGDEGKPVVLKVKMEETGKAKFIQSAFTILPDETGANRLMSISIAGTTTKAVIVP